MSEQYLVVQSEFDYADEFDVYGLYITTKTLYDMMMEEAKKYFDVHDDYEGWFGTNEAILVESFEDYQAGLHVSEITEETYHALNKALNPYYKGESKPFSRGRFFFIELDE